MFFQSAHQFMQKQGSILWRHYVLVLLICLVLGLLARGFLFEPYRVNNGALSPDVLPGDIVWVSKWRRSPQVGDLVLFRCPHMMNTYCLRRVAVKPGGWITENEGDNSGTRVPPGYIWVTSEEGYPDSEDFGVVAVGEVVGRATHIVWSLSSTPKGSQVNWSRIFKILN